MTCNWMLLLCQRQVRRCGVSQDGRLHVRLARDVIRHLTVPDVKSSMADEAVYQTMINRSDDFAEFRAAHAEGRDPRYQGS